MRRTGRFRWAIWSGWVVTTLATGLLILLDIDTKTYAWVLIFITVGWGHGLILMSLNYCTQALAKDRDVGYAAVMYTFSRTFGLCIGVTVGGTVFQNKLKTHLVSLHLPTSMAENAEGYIAQIQSSPQRHAFSVALARSIQNVAEFMTVIAALAGILSLFIGSASTDKELASEHVLRRRSPNVMSAERSKTVTISGRAVSSNKLNSMDVAATHSKHFSSRKNWVWIIEELKSLRLNPKPMRSDGDILLAIFPPPMDHKQLPRYSHSEHLDTTVYVCGIALKDLGQAYSKKDLTFDYDIPIIKDQIWLHH